MNVYIRSTHPPFMLSFISRHTKPFLQPLSQQYVLEVLELHERGWYAFGEGVLSEIESDEICE